MTDKQIIEESWPLAQLAKNRTDEQERRYTELNCLNMISSILAYDWPYLSERPIYDYRKGVKNKEHLGYFPCTKENVLKADLLSYRSYLQEYVNKLGKERVLELIQEQIDSIERVETGAFTDSEGCSYNTIIYKKENI